MLSSECIQFCNRNNWAKSAISTIRAAVEHARICESGYLGNEHLLLALLSTENRATSLVDLCNSGAAGSIVNFLTEHKIKNSDPLTAPAADEMDLTPSAMRIVTGANALPANFVDCEHILISFLLDNDSYGHSILAQHGITYDVVIENAKTIVSE